MAGTLNGAAGPEDGRGRGGMGVLCAALVRLGLSAWPPEPAAAQPATAHPIAKQTATSGGSLLSQPSDPDTAFNLITRTVFHAVNDRVPNDQAPRLPPMQGKAARWGAGSGR